jgi:dTDP-4-dehydrorhamnose 3,5-epimerase
MRVEKTTAFQEALIVEADAFRDKRGYFMETYHQEKYGQLGIKTEFVQDNLSYSVRGTLRGLHYQCPHGQAKLVQVISGEIFDVILDIRQGSPTFGQWTGVTLSDENNRQFYVPEGFAHGFCALSETALVLYKCSDFYAPESERGILWSDPDVGIEWPIAGPMLSDKDSKYSRLKDIPKIRLPLYET